MNTTPNSISITLQLCEDDRKRIDELIAFTGLMVGEVRSYKDALKFQSAPTLMNPDTLNKAPATSAPQVPTTQPDPAPVVETPAPTPEPVADPEPPVKSVSLAEFQKAITIAVSKSPAAKAATRAIIHKYATSVSAVPEDKRVEVMAELSKI